MPTLDDAVGHYAAALTTAARELDGITVVASYLHGSAALGGFTPGRSDVDVLFVVGAGAKPKVARSLGEALIAVAGCPGVGLEVSAVTLDDATHPAPPWPFVVHATSAPGDRKVVVGAAHRGDPDLALHYAVVRQSGYPVDGPPPAQVIGPVAREVVLSALRDELAWGLEHGATAYAVLNAARALRYAAEGILCSKLDGGAWAITHGEPIDLIQPALEQQRNGVAMALGAVEKAWIEGVIDRL